MLDVPTHTQIQRQMVVDHPVVLDIGAELLVLGGDKWAEARNGGRSGEEYLVRQGGCSAWLHVIEELRAGVARILRPQRHFLVFDAHFDGVIAHPVEVAEGQVVLYARTLLSLVLGRQRTGCAGGQYRRVVVRPIGVHLTVAAAECDRCIERFLMREQQFVGPQVRTMLPANIDACVIVLGRVSGGQRGAAAVAAILILLAILGAGFDAIAIGEFPVDLGEVQILGERQAGRSYLAPHVGRQQSRCSRHARGDVGRLVEALGFVAEEEMHRVLDDRAADREAVFFLVRLGLVACRLFGRRGVAVGVAGIAAEHLAVEVVSARLGFGRHRGAGNLVVLRLVVRGDDLVFADRQLRERVALRADLAADAALFHVALLADAVDVDVRRAVVLRTAAQRGIAARIDGEHHARHGIGKLEEVARQLRHSLDLVQRNIRADFRRLYFCQRGRRDGYPLQRGGSRRGGCSGCRGLEIQGRCGCDCQRDRPFRSGARVDLIGARWQADQRVAAVGRTVGMAHCAGCDVLRRDLHFRRRLSAQCSVRRLRPADGGCGDQRYDRSRYQRCEQFLSQRQVLFHGSPPGGTY